MKYVFVVNPHSGKSELKEELFKELKKYNYFQEDISFLWLPFMKKLPIHQAYSKICYFSLISFILTFT